MVAVEKEIDISTEIARCRASVVYFIWTYCRLRDRQAKAVVPFHLWPQQARSLKIMVESQFSIHLKARQTGYSSLVVARAVHLALFQPGAVILLFSRGIRESKDLIRRFKAMVGSLPDWMKPAMYPTDATQELELSNGSRLISFASRGSGGDSYTADLAIVDEADLIADLNELLEGLEPTVAASGQLIMLSRVDKSKPNSAFKAVYRAAVAGENEYAHSFTPWFAKPGRTQKWYEIQKRNTETRTGALDDLWSNYPATPEEALAPRTLDKRLPFKWLNQCFEAMPELPLTVTPFAGLAGNLRVYELPRRGEEYIGGMDVAEGNPNSDDSVICMMNRRTLRQVAILVGKYEPSVLATYGARISEWYNRAWLNIERNNHGFAAIDEARRLRCRILAGRDNKLGWWTDLRGKSFMYDAVAESVRCASCTIVDKQTLEQLSIIENGSLSAPEGNSRNSDTYAAQVVQHDDCAVAFALALHGACTPIRKGDLNVINFSRNPEPDAPAPVQATEGVNWIESIGEYWVQRTAPDGSRVDFFGSADRAEAQEAARIVDAMIGQKGPVAPPSDPGHLEIYRLLLNRGCIQ